MRIVQILLVITSISLSFSSFGQEEHVEHEPHSKNRIAGFIGHTYIPLGFLPSIDNGFLVVPSLGLAYDRHIADKWSLGIHTELESATYVIEHSGGAELERERPLIIALVVAYVPWKNLILEAGFGRELEKNESFWIYRIGAGYEIEIANEWDFAPGIFFDIKEDIYTSLTFGLQVGKKF